MTIVNPRPDISDKLIHFTNGTDHEDAYNRLKKILAQRKLIGTGGKIKGGYQCVCFTEAPLPSLQFGLVNPYSYSRYAPFGILFEKQWVFEQGGRPVIYQSDAEFDQLSEDIRWRHMRYEPPLIDFTWEREWRMRCSELELAPSVAGIVLPDKEWEERMIAEHRTEQDFQVLQYSLIMDEEFAEHYREGFGWVITSLRAA